MAMSGGESEKDADVPDGHPSADGDHSMELPVGVTTAAGDESEICSSGVSVLDNLRAATVSYGRSMPPSMLPKVYFKCHICMHRNFF